MMRKLTEEQIKLLHEVMTTGNCKSQQNCKYCILTHILCPFVVEGTTPSLSASARMKAKEKAKEILSENF